MSVLFTFPGQGAQRPGMLHALPDHAETARTLDEASAALGRDVAALDTDAALRSTVAVQLCLLVAGVAMALRLDDTGLLRELRVALTGTNSHPLWLQGTDALLGRPVDETGLGALGKLVQKQLAQQLLTQTRPP